MPKTKRRSRHKDVRSDSSPEQKTQQKSPRLETRIVANPPRRNLVMLVVSGTLFLIWFVCLLILAIAG